MSRWIKSPLSVFRRNGGISRRAAHRSADLVGTSVSESKPPSPFNAGSRYYIATAKETFKEGRYEAIRQLGGGRYSHVWLARDLQKDIFVALKLLTTDCYGTDHDIYEVDILRTITKEQAQLNDGSKSHCISLLDIFQLEGPTGTHECIVMPVVGSNMMDQAMRFTDKRIPVAIMKKVTKQLLVGLSFLHDKCGVIHTDLHPSNICFEIEDADVKRIRVGESVASVTATVTEDRPGDVRIIDFGVASWVHQHLSDNLQPEHLRAPEVILGASWGPPVDIWSLGCLVIELVKGHVAFPGAASERGTWSSEDDHLAQYMEVLGVMPPELLQRGRKTDEYFNAQGNLLRIPTLKLTSLNAFIDGKEGPLKRPRDMTDDDLPAFVDFLQGALALDPQDRKTAKELLQHEWLRQPM